VVSLGRSDVETRIVIHRAAWRCAAADKREGCGGVAVSVCRDASASTLVTRILSWSLAAVLGR